MLRRFWRPVDWRSRPVCVLGNGLQGRHIAACFVAAGYHVWIQNSPERDRMDASAYIDDNIEDLLAISGRAEAGTYEAIEQSSFCPKTCWIVIATKPEDTARGSSLYDTVTKMAPDDCIIATTYDYHGYTTRSGARVDAVRKRMLQINFPQLPQVRDE